MPTKVSKSLITSIDPSQITTTGATAGQVLTFNSSTSTWSPSAVPSSLPNLPNTAFPNYNSLSAIITNGTYDNVVRQTSVNGYLIITGTTTYSGRYFLYVGTTSNPTTLVAQGGDDDTVNGYTNFWSSITPLPAGIYFKVSGANSPIITVTWCPTL